MSRRIHVASTSPAPTAERSAVIRPALGGGRQDPRRHRNGIGERHDFGTQVGRLGASQDQLDPRRGDRGESELLVEALSPEVALGSTRSALIPLAQSITSRTSRVPYPRPRYCGRVTTLASRTVRHLRQCGFATPISRVPIAVATIGESPSLLRRHRSGQRTPTAVTDALGDLVNTGRRR